MSPTWIFLLLTAVFAGSLLTAYDIPGFPPDEIVEYKQTTDSSGDPVGLDLHIFSPPDLQAGDQRAAIVFFFGGGWSSGSPGQFHPHCSYLASRGMVAISAEYRIQNEHGTSPQECVKDGKSAVRWIRENAASLGIDPNRIAAGGGSAGGHVAAAAGTLTAYEEPGENSAISSRPNALVLYNPVYDNGPGGYGHSRISSYWEDFSPLHNIDDTTPPAIVFLGTNDALIPVATATEFQGLMEAQGIRSDLHLYQDQPHSFFNYDIPDDTRGPYYGYQDTIFKSDRFLVSLGYLEEASLNPQPLNNWITIFGDTGFTNGSESTSSPVTSDADLDAIAAPIPEIDLEDGDFVRLTGTVTFDVALPGASFQIGLFGSDSPLSSGSGSGYRGIWSEAPATSASQVKAGDGSGTSHPFESAHSSTLGPIPGATSTLPANTPLAFSLMIARNGNEYDLTTSFDDGIDYRPAQNLLHQTLAGSSYDRVAIFMSDDLNGSTAQFSELTVSSGRLPSTPVPESPPAPPSRVITYLDAVAGASGNTFATGSNPGDLSWLVDPGSSGPNQTQWGLRSLGNDTTVLQALHSLPDTIPELTTRISGLDDGTYEIWAFYWDQIINDSQNWTLSAGLTSGNLGSYRSPDEPSVPNATTDQVFNANDLNFSTEILTIDGDGLRNLFGVNLGRVTVDNGQAIDIFTDNLLGNGSSNRTWFDGVGYARVNTYETWISGFNLGAESAPDDDPDRDGIANAFENLYGTDPGLPGHPGITVATSGTANQFNFRHPLNPNVAEDLTSRYQWSEDLVRFHEDGIPDQHGTVVTFSSAPDPSSPGFTIVTATRTGPSSLAPLFLRIAIESSPF